jgi:o-succinylbenzoate---CoA ligase
VALIRGTMRDWLAAAAEEHPDRLAVEADDGRLTYAELNARADKLARHLHVSVGERVQAAATSDLAFVTLLHALPRRAAALEPLPADRPGPVLASAEPQPGELRFDHPPDAVHTVIATSGTTGEPKLVELTYRNHAASAAAAADALGTEPGDRWLCPLPLHHVGGLNILIRSAIHGTTAVLHQGFDAERVRAVLETGEVTLASLVPTMLARLRDAGLRWTPGLRAIALGGGPVPAGLLHWAAGEGIPVTPVYGMTETCSQVVAGIPGRALRGAELRISEEGEVLIRGNMVASATRRADGWLHTGDRGRLDADGLLHVEGRIKELIVTGGENVAPLEVEQALLTHPAVADAGVAGVPDPLWGEAITAYVVLSKPVDEGELDAWARARLEPYKVPKAIHTLSELPRNAAGKLLRDRLTDGPH